MLAAGGSPGQTARCRPSARPGSPPPIPAAAGQFDFGRAHTAGYMSAIEWRFVSGGAFREHAAGSAWTRPLIPLLPGEQPSPMSRSLLVADSGSGVGAALDPAKFQYINVDLTVVLPRDPAGEWLLLESATTIGADGTGLTESVLSDTDRPVRWRHADAAGGAALAAGQAVQ